MEEDLSIKVLCQGKRPPPSKSICSVTDIKHGRCLSKSQNNFSVWSNWIGRESSLSFSGSGRSLVYSSQLLRPTCARELYYSPAVLAAVQILTFCVCILSGALEDKMKNRGMEGRHLLPGGWEVFLFFLTLREKKGIKREEDRRRGLNVEENNKRQEHKRHERCTEGLIETEREG